MWKTKFSSHKQYLVDHLFPRNVKKSHTDQSILETFFTLSEKKHLKKPLKVAAVKKSFSSVISLIQLLRQMFFIPCDNWKALFFIHIYTYLYWSDVENERESDVGFSTLHNDNITSVSDVETTTKQRCTTSIQRWINVVST